MNHLTPDELVTLSIPITWVVMMLMELVGETQRWPGIPMWRSTSVSFFVLLMSINAFLPSQVPPAWLEHALVPIASLDAISQVVIGYLALSLANALMHRANHRFDFLWRWVHQLHHAPQRLDVAGGVIASPWEMAINTSIFLLVIVAVLGLDPVPAALVAYIATFYSLFQHLSLSTPRWLGYLIQRPEAHGVHHRRGLHGYNYSDLPLWDMLMGTWRNPRLFNGDVGFEGRARPAYGLMLRGRDANAKLYGAGRRGTSTDHDNPA